MRLKKLYIFIFLIITIFALSGCKNSETKDLNSKVNEEINYMSVSLISILNKLNNISFENYYVTTEEVSKDSDPSSEQGSNSMQSSAEMNDEDKSKNSNQNVTGGDGGQQDNKISVSTIKAKRVLSEDRTNIDWTTIKNDIESFYLTWNSIIIDLYKLGVNNQDILNFSSKLDETVINIKNENKVDSLRLLSELYSIIPTFMNSYVSDQTDINIQLARSYVINAYALVEKNDWNSINDQIKKAEEAFNNVMTDVNFINEKNYNVNKTYVSLKELQNSISLNDPDVFYIKYKTFMEEINLL